MSVLNVLNRDTWTQRHYATDRAGQVVDPDSPSACKFCLAGAVRRVYGSAFQAVLNKLYDECPCGVTAYNDHPGRTWEDIEALIKKAGV